MENTGFLGVARQYFLRIIFLKFLQINNSIPYLLAAPKKITFSLKFLCASHLKIKHFELPPANEMEDMKIKLTEMHTRCPILAVTRCWLSVILQISNFEAILYLGHFFIHPVEFNGSFSSLHWKVITWLIPYERPSFDTSSFVYIVLGSTHVKMSQLVASLQRSR